jgi:hypothetical protein
MATIQMKRHATDGSKRVKTFRVKTDKWIKSTLPGANGQQPLWYYIATCDNRVIGKAIVYEDRNPYRARRRKSLRIYKWSANLPDPSQTTKAHGESVSLSGAMTIASTCCYIDSSPFDSAIHG